MSRNYISKNDELRKGDYLLSSNQKYKAIFQDDGNFVIYANENSLWASNTWRSDAFRLCLLGNCSLVMYNKYNIPRWSTASDTIVSNMCRLQLTDEGILELYREADLVWSSTKSLASLHINH